MKINIKIVFFFLLSLVFVMGGNRDAYAGKKVLRVGIIESLSGSHE